MKNNISGSPIRVGIIANEFFDEKVGRMGGFGWAAQRAAQVLQNHPESNTRVFFLNSETGKSSTRYRKLNGIPFIPINGNRIQNFLKLLPKRIDIVLTIDYRSTYRGVFNALPFTPIVTWVRDPRPPEAIDKIMSLKIPGKEDVPPAGIHDNKTEELARYRYRRFPMSNSVILANKMPHMKAVNPDVYELPESNFVLPNPSVVDYNSLYIHKSEKPSVLFMGRLDPIKRPWLFIKLAKQFPDVDFFMLGKNHFNGEDGWDIHKVPENVKLMGHVSGEKKHNFLSSAWALVNTSIHEESPVSVMEAFAFETPVLSYEDWGGLVKDRGIAIGQHPGTGMNGLNDLTNALNKLISDDSLRKKYGKAARHYVETVHNDERFLTAFRDICLASGITKASHSITV